MPNTEFLLIACLAATFVGLSKGGLPVVGMLGVPVLSLLTSPVQAATLLLPIYVLSDMVGIWLYRRDYSSINLKILVPAGVLGVLLGWSTAAYLSDRAIGFLIGGLGVGFCLNAWIRHASAAEARPAHVGKGLFWGAMAGFTSFISHSGGPPFQIYVLPQRLTKTVFAGTSTLFFAFINAAKIIPYQQLRPYSVSDLQTAAWLMPAALIGTVAGAWLTRRIVDRWFFRLVQWALFLISLQLIYKALNP